MDEWLMNHLVKDMDYVLQVIAVLKNARWTKGWTWP